MNSKKCSRKVRIRLVHYIFAAFLIFLLSPVCVLAAEPKAKISSPSDQAAFDLGKSVTVETALDPAPEFEFFSKKKHYVRLRVRHDETTILNEAMEWTRILYLHPKKSFTPDEEGEYRIEVAYYMTEDETAPTEEEFVAEYGISIRVIRDLQKSAVEITGLNDMVYNGGEQTPEPLVKIGEKTLNHETDYMLSYTNNTNAGEAQVQVTGKGFYKGTVSGSFLIKPADITKAAVSGISDQYYSGSETGQSPVVTLGGRKLVEGRDYEVSCENNIHAGTASIQIRGTGNYSGTIDKTFRILPVSMVNAVVSGIADKNYTGQPITQTPAVSYGGKALVQGTDYTVSYKNNTEPGTATVMITGKGDFKDTITRTFSITESTSSGDILQIRDSTTQICSDFNVGEEVWICEYTNVYVFNNGERDPYYYYVRISKGGTKLDFFEYSTTSPGVYLMKKFIPDQKGDYLIEMSKSEYIPRTEAQFTPRWSKVIHVGSARTDISGGSISGITDKEYTGNAITQKVVVKVNGKTLTEGTDYYVTYLNNVNVGRAAMIIYGKGNYKGRLDQGTTFMIKPKTIREDMITLSPESFTYNGEVKKPAVSVKNGAFLLAEGKDYILTNEGGSIPGSYQVKVEAKGGSNYTGNASRNYAIDKLPLADASLVVSPSSYVYDGSAKEPSVTVLLDGNPVAAENYTVSYRNNTNAGKAGVTVKANEDSYYKGQLAGSFAIEKYDINASDVIVTPPEDVVYSRKAQTPAPTAAWGEKTLSKDTDYTLTYAGNTDVGTASVMINGSGNFAGSRKTSFRIAQKDIASPSITVEPVPDQPLAEGAACEPEIIVRDGSAVLNGKEISVAYKDNDREGTASAVITGIGNYSGSREDVSFRILSRKDYAHSQLSAQVQALKGENLSTYLKKDQDALSELLSEAASLLEKEDADPVEMEEMIYSLTRALEKAKENLASYLKAKEAEAAARAAEAAAKAAKKKAAAAKAREKAMKAALKIPSAAKMDQAIKNQKTDKDPAGASYLPLKLTSIKQGKNYITLKWSKVAGASQYIVYGNQCGKKKRIKKIAVLKKTTYKHKALKKGTYYKYVVMAVKNTVAGKRAAAISPMIHVAVKGGRVCNPGRMKLMVKNGKKFKMAGSVTIRKGKTKILRVKLAPASKIQKLKQHVGIRFASSDARVASVSKKGVIRARTAGKCVIYAYAQNGSVKQVKIKVK